MSGYWRGLSAVCLLAAAGSVWGDEPPAAAHFRQHVEPILAKYCYACHGDGAEEGGVRLDGFASDEELLAARDRWAAALKNVRADVMPPAGEERPTPDEVAALAAWIKQDVIGIDPEHPDPGRVTLRRLNRREYQNTIRDLMGVKFNALVEFPPDDAGFGFDNIGDVLSVSPLLMEKYLQAAEAIVAEAVPTARQEIPEQAFAGRRFRGADRAKTAERMSFYEPLDVGRRIEIPRDGEYKIVLAMEVDGESEADPGRCRVVFRIDDEEKWRQEFDWADRKAVRAELDGVPLSDGRRRLSFKLEPLAPADQRKNRLDFRVLSVRVIGPIEADGWKPPPNYARFFPQGPPSDDATQRGQYARELLREFAGRAFRRPVDDATVERLAAIVDETAAEEPMLFESGVARAMTAVLASPRFLFRVEDVEPLDDGEKFPLVDEYALASRLSYFFWSTMPDAELFDLAARGELRKNLDAQVQRLLADERSDEFVRNFTGQWLMARDVESVSINARAVLRDTRRRDEEGRRIEFNNDLRRAMQRETEMQFAHVLRNDRSVLEFLDCDYAFLNERLAKHYGVEGVEGDEMRLVELPDDSPRGGLLTQGTMLTVTSNPTRTSPVKRGLYILDNVLGTPAPPAPPDVPALEEAAQGLDHEPTLRETLEIHRSKALCASCHNRMDPLGLALENFNALGIWRDTENGQPIDASGQLISGEEFSTIVELKEILKTQRHMDFYRCIADKMLTYALGRGLEHDDLETVDKIVEGLDVAGGAMSALVDGVVNSAPFQRQRPAETSTAEK